LLDLRGSRALTAFVTGASLALAGVMMQALLRNRWPIPMCWHLAVRRSARWRTDVHVRGLGGGRGGLRGAVMCR